VVVSPKGEPTEAIPIHRSEHCQPRTGANAGLSRSGQRWPAPSSGASIVVERDSQILEAAPNLLVLDEIERLPGLALSPLFPKAGAQLGVLPQDAPTLLCDRVAFRVSLGDHGHMVPADCPPPEAGSWGCGFRTSRRFCRPSGISPIR